MDEEVFEVSFLTVAAAFIGAFASRDIDKAMALPFPADLILLLLSFAVLWTIMYYVMKYRFFRKKLQ